MSRMRRSLRFLSSCSSSSFIAGISFLPVIEQKVFASNAAQDHAFQAVQIVKSVTRGFGDSRKHGRAWIVPNDAQQLAQDIGEIAVTAFFQGGQVFGKLGSRL